MLKRFVGKVVFVQFKRDCYYQMLFIDKEGQLTPMSMGGDRDGKRVEMPVMMPYMQGLVEQRDDAYVLVIDDMMGQQQGGPGGKLEIAIADSSVSFVTEAAPNAGKLVIL